MIDFPIHAIEDAPPKARPTLERIQKQFGFIPNLFGEMAEARPALEGYLRLDEQFRGTSLTPVEQGVVLLAASLSNQCEYCVAVHSAELARAGLPRAETERLRDGQPLSDDRLEALRRFTQTLVEDRGHVDEHEIEAFLNAGCDRQQILEVALGVSMKTLSNYVNHIADTPLDERFAEFAWERETATAAAAGATA